MMKNFDIDFVYFRYVFECCTIFLFSLFIRYQNHFQLITSCSEFCFILFFGGKIQPHCFRFLGFCFIILVINYLIYGEEVVID
jgi:hypothetical protein